VAVKKRGKPYSGNIPRFVALGSSHSCDKAANEVDEMLLNNSVRRAVCVFSLALLGAGSATGVDIDPQAIKASNDNAAQNEVQAAFYLPDGLPQGQFDVVVANILANPLRMLGDMLASRTRTGGRIVLSGILEEQIDEMSAIYAQWFDLAPAIVNNGWACITGTKR